MLLEFFSEYSILNVANFVGKFNPVLYFSPPSGRPLQSQKGPRDQARFRHFILKVAITISVTRAPFVFV